MVQYQNIRTEWEMATYCVCVLKYLETNLDYPMNKRYSFVIVYDTLLETKISPSEPALLRDVPPPKHMLVPCRESTKQSHKIHGRYTFIPNT